MNELDNFDLQVFINIYMACQSNLDLSRKWPLNSTSIIKIYLLFSLSMLNLKLPFVTSFNTYTSVRLEERPVGMEGRDWTQKNVREWEEATFSSMCLVLCGRRNEMNRNARPSLCVCWFAFLLQIITTFSVVDNMKEQFYAQQGKISRFDILAITLPVLFFYFIFFVWVQNFPSKCNTLAPIHPGKMI